MTLLQHVKFRPFRKQMSDRLISKWLSPVLPDLSEMRMTRIEVEVLIFSRASWRLLFRMEPSSRIIRSAGSEPPRQRTPTPDVSDTSVEQERLDQVEKASELREDDGLFLPFPPYFDILQELEQHPSLCTSRRKPAIAVGCSSS